MKRRLFRRAASCLMALLIAFGCFVPSAAAAEPYDFDFTLVTDRYATDDPEPNLNLSLDSTKYAIVRNYNFDYTGLTDTGYTDGDGNAVSGSSGGRSGGKYVFQVMPVDNLQAGYGVVSIDGNEQGIKAGDLLFENVSIKPIDGYPFNITVDMVVKPKETMHLVTIDLDGGTMDGYIGGMFVADGGMLPELREPVKEGYVFEGWMAEQTIDGEAVPYDFGDPVTCDITLTAMWMSILPEAPETVEVAITAENRQYIGYNADTADLDLVIPEQFTDPTMGPNVVCVPTSIGDEAFYGCTNLRYVSIPGTVGSIGVSAFDGCSGLTEIDMEDMGFESGYSMIGVCAFIGTALNTVVFPDTLTSIGESAFDSLVSLTDISSLADCSSLDTIGTRAFYGTSIMNVTLPDSITDLGVGVFQECAYLESVTLPQNLVSIGYWAFCNDASLSSISFPETLQTIDSFAFFGCRTLSEIGLPASVELVGEHAFDECVSLNVVRLPSEPCDMTIESFAFRNTNVFNFVIPNTFQGQINDYVFGTQEDAETSPTAYNAYYIYAEPNKNLSIAPNAFAGCIYFHSHQDILDRFLMIVDPETGASTDPWNMDPNSLSRYGCSGRNYWQEEVLPADDPDLDFFVFYCDDASMCCTQEIYAGPDIWGMYVPTEPAAEPAGTASFDASVDESVDIFETVPFADGVEDFSVVSGADFDPVYTVYVPDVGHDNRWCEKRVSHSGGGYINTKFVDPYSSMHTVAFSVKNADFTVLDGSLSLVDLNDAYKLSCPALIFYPSSVLPIPEDGFRPVEDPYKDHIYCGTIDPYDPYVYNYGVTYTNPDTGKTGAIARFFRQGHADYPEASNIFMVPAYDVTENLRITVHKVLRGAMFHKQYAAGVGIAAYRDDSLPGETEDGVMSVTYLGDGMRRRVGSSGEGFDQFGQLYVWTPEQLSDKKAGESCGAWADPTEFSVMSLAEYAPEEYGVANPDLNQDGVVDMYDSAAIMNIFRGAASLVSGVVVRDQMTMEMYFRADLDRSDTVDSNDFMAWKQVVDEASKDEPVCIHMYIPQPYDETHHAYYCVKCKMFDESTVEYCQMNADTQCCAKCLQELVRPVYWVWYNQDGTGENEVLFTETCRVSEDMTWDDIKALGIQDPPDHIGASGLEKHVWTGTWSEHVSGGALYHVAEYEPVLDAVEMLAFRDFIPGYSLIVYETDRQDNAVALDGHDMFWSEFDRGYVYIRANDEVAQMIASSRITESLNATVDILHGSPNIPDMDGDGEVSDDDFNVALHIYKGVITGAYDSQIDDHDAGCIRYIIFLDVNGNMIVDDADIELMVNLDR